jgi:hypothetical protein
MVIDSFQETQPIVQIKGKSYIFNVKEYESFIEQCDQFMCVENDGIDTMIQVVTDQIIDSASPATTIDEIRPQLRFMREISFLLKNLVSPVENYEDREER